MRRLLSPSPLAAAAALALAFTAAPVSAGSTPTFANVAKASGIDFTHNNGATGKKWLPETMGSGCAWVDYDVDGDPDALLLSGKDWPGYRTGGRSTPGLFRNAKGKFTDVTREAGLADSYYGIGVTAGDYDGDGDPDLYVTVLGPNRLYRNDRGTFVEVGKKLGVATDGFGSSATWVDYDKDGDLDLMALNYVQWTPETDIFCTLDGTNKSYCSPEPYQGDTPRLYRNDGGRFSDVTEAAGVYDPTAKGLGIVAFDYDADGWEDLYLANDTQPNFLLRNQGNGTFSEEGVFSGVAFDESGKAQGTMGVDVADYDGTGRPSLVTGNFSNEMLNLYHNEGHGFFIDAAPTSAVGRQSLLTLAFGCFFFDCDLDGLPDIFVTNGHIENEIEAIQENVTFAEPPHLFHNMGGGRFEDVAGTAGDLAQPIVGRGSAYADYDGDGDLDLLVNVSRAPARLYRNDLATGAHALRVLLVGGAGSNPDGLGAEVSVLAGGVTRTAWARAGHSYASQSERVLTFGLGKAERADEVIVRWPSGKTSRMVNVLAGPVLRVKESEAS